MRLILSSLLLGRPGGSLRRVISSSPREAGEALCAEVNLSLPREAGRLSAQSLLSFLREAGRLSAQSVLLSPKGGREALCAEVPLSP